MFSDSQLSASMDTGRRGAQEVWEFPTVRGQRYAQECWLDQGQSCAVQPWPKHSHHGEGWRGLEIMLIELWLCYVDLKYQK